MKMKLVAACCLLLTSLTTNGPITAGETEITNDYPESVTFEIEAASAAAAIVSVDLDLSTRGDSSTTIYPAEFTPGQQVNARFEWKTRRDGVPPGALVRYTWTIEDEAGNTFETEAEEYVVTDARFTWQMLESDDLALWWYDGDAEFGQHVFDAATRALEAMEDNTGLSLAHRVHVVLYGAKSDFDAWHSYPREWVGGEAYSEMALTVQIVPPDEAESVAWYTQALIPHEIAHLFFYQATHDPLSSTPHTWLNEGFAQYHELVSHERDLAWVRQAAQSGDLIPLRLASGSFTGDDERIALLYAESLSAVTFLHERWGDQGMGQLLTAFEEGDCNTDKALLQATGLDFEEFQLAWWEWLGGPSDAYPTRVPTPSMTMATLPPPAQPPTVSPTHTPIPTPLAPAAPERPLSCLPCAGAMALLGLWAMCGWRALYR